MAVPSYTHNNPLLRWLFWSRLDTAVALGRPGAGERVLDFASGSGVLLPTLAAAGCEVYATDLIPGPWMAHAKAAGLDVTAVPLAGLREFVMRERGTFALVYALDVLEHVDDRELEALSGLFARLLRADGRLVMSGATETALYRVARRLAGFRSDYHHRSIFDVHRVFERGWRLEARRVLPPRPLPGGFVVSRYRPRS
ncbi:MAG TPA: methyltransferase domain-containing protein [Candidatus Limnocylindria bacterium]|nr:methyltransferase domain-containing protein [Candidatus Limnocylindria bacterium]